MDYNPLAQMTVFYQKLILDGVLPTGGEWVFLCSFVLASLIIGGMVFRRSQESFAELL
jgi:ABC-type polysaccharide/polyol phosphate export permease